MTHLNDRSAGGHIHRLDLVPCPECGLPAEVVRRDTMVSTGESLEMVMIRCLDRHWFYMPSASLERYAPLSARDEDDRALSDPSTEVEPDQRH